MANNKIQIKRSPTTATPASLSAGELAFSNVTGGSGVLFIGSTDGGTVVPIGGARYPGTLTANQALVANSTSGIDKIITANLTLSSFSVNTINAVANLTHLGTSVNTELTTTWAIKTYVDAKAAAASNPQGANASFQYNDSGVLNGTLNMFYNNTTNTVSIGNSTVNVQLGFTGSINALAHFHGYQNGYTQIVMQNGNSQSRASADYVAENDLGSETENYIDLGINSSTYNDPAFSAMGAGDSYLYAANNNLTIGTADAGELKFITGGTTSAQIRAVIDAGGNVAIGATSADALLKVSGTANITGLTTIGANLVLRAGVTANGGVGSAGHVLKSGGSGANVYWEAPSATVAGSSTQVQYNDGGSTLAGATGFTYDKNTNNVQIANSLNIPANGAYGNTTTGGSIANSTVFATGNSTVNSIHSSGLLQVSNSTSTANLTAADLKIGGTTVVNGSQITATLFSGSLTGTYANISGQVNTATLYAATSANIASVVQANSTGIWTTATANAQNFTAGGGFGASGVGVTVNSGIIGISSNLTVNSSLTASLLQVSNSTGNVQYTATTILAQTSATVNATMSAATIQVANSTGTSNLTAYGLKAGANVEANTTTLKVGNTNFTTTAATLGGTLSANGSTGTAGYLLVSAGSGANAYWSNSLGNVAFVDVTVSGNLTVLGDLVSLNVATLAVEDSLIVLAKDQSNTGTYTDALDIGFYGAYGNTQAANKKWAGLFRDQSDSGIFKLFDGAIPEPTTLIDTANVNFAFATLQAQLKAGGAGAGALIANSSHVNITANSTTNVFITANTLALSTALPVTSGGLGLSSVAVSDLLVGNSTNTLSRLSVGSEGYVLQVTSTGTVVWNTLDGGTF